MSTVAAAATAADDDRRHDCVICAGHLGSKGGTLTLLCDHAFCHNCILKWRQISRRCPICRKRDVRDLGSKRSVRVQKLLKKLLASNDNDLVSLLDPLLQEFKAKQNGGASTESILDPPTSIAGASSPSDSPGSSGPGSRRVDRQLLKQLVAALQDIASSDPPPARDTMQPNNSITSQRTSDPTDSPPASPAARRGSLDPAQSIQTPVTSPPTSPDTRPLPAAAAPAAPAALMSREAQAELMETQHVPSTLLSTRAQAAIMGSMCSELDGPSLIAAHMAVLNPQGTGPPHFVPTAQGTFVHPAQAALSNFANPFRDTAAEPDPAHPTAPKPPRYSPVTPSIPPTSPLVPRSSQQLLSAPSSFSNPEAVHHSGAVHQKGAPTMGERKSGPVNLIEKRESFRTRRREREAALRSAECSASLLAGAKSSMDSEVSRLHSSASLAPTKEAPDMGDVHKSMDGVVSRWAAMPTGIMRPDFVRTMDDRIEQAYVDCIKLQGQQDPSVSSIKQVLGQLTAIRRELRQLHRSPSASRPLSKVSPFDLRDSLGRKMPPTPFDHRASPGLLGPQLPPSAVPETDLSVSCPSKVRRAPAGSKDSARPSVDSTKRVSGDPGLAKHGAATFSFGGDKALLGPCLLGDPSVLAKRASRAAEAAYAGCISFGKERRQ